MGVSVTVSKLNYNTRSKNFNLAVNLNTNDIKIDTKDDMLTFYRKSYEKTDATEVPVADQEVIRNLKQKVFNSCLECISRKFISK